MGDSCTFGVGVEADQAYPARMEALLGDTCPDWCGDVVNAGIPGTSIYQQRLLFEKKLLPLRPDIVTVYSSPNWVDNIKDFRDASERQRWLRSAQRILRKSTLYSLLLKKIRGGPVERAHFEATRFETNLERYSMDEILADYEEDLDLLIRMSRKHDFKLLFVNFPLEQNIYGNRYSPPWYDSRHTPLIHLRAKAGDIVYLDLVGELRKHSDEVLFLDGVHPTPRGHQRIARALVDRMIESGLLAPASELPPK